MHNARLEPRVATDVPAAVLGITSDDDDHSARVLDVSETGLFLHTELPMQVGDTLAVRLEIDGQLVLVPAAEVMWHRPSAATGPMGAGLRFVALDGAARQVLRSHVLQRLGPLPSTVPKRHRDLDDTLDLLPRLRASLLEDNLSSEARVFANIAPTPRSVTMLPTPPTTELQGWSFRAQTATEQQADVHARATIIPTQIPTVHGVSAIPNASVADVAIVAKRRLHRHWQGAAMVVAGAACATVSAVVVGQWPATAKATHVDIATVATVATVEAAPISVAAVPPPPTAPLVVEQVVERVMVAEPVVVAERAAAKPVVPVVPVVAAPVAAPRELHMKLPAGATISRTFVLHAPERVVVDLTGMTEQPRAPTELPITITGVRVGQPSPGVSRVVLALSEPSTTAKASLRQGVLHVRY